MHATEQVLQALQALLVAGPTGVGPRVYADRNFPIAEFPAIRILDTVDETIDPETVHWPRLEQHTLSVPIELHARVPADLRAALTVLRTQVETVLFAAPELAVGVGGDIAFARARRATYDLDTQAELKQGTCTLQVEITYRTFAHAPEALA